VGEGCVCIHVVSWVDEVIGVGWWGVVESCSRVLRSESEYYLSNWGDGFLHSTRGVIYCSEGGGP
jgi:hypothetical protein